MTRPTRPGTPGHPAAGPRVASPVQAAAMSLPLVPDPGSSTSRGLACTVASSVGKRVGCKPSRVRISHPPRLQDHQVLPCPATGRDPAPHPCGVKRTTGDRAILDVARIPRSAGACHDD